MKYNQINIQQTNFDTNKLRQISELALLTRFKQAINNLSIWVKVVAPLSLSS